MSIVAEAMYCSTPRDDRKEQILRKVRSHVLLVWLSFGALHGSIDSPESVCRHWNVYIRHAGRATVSKTLRGFLWQDP